MCVGGGGGEEGGKGGLMPPPQGFVNEVIKGWMPPPSDFANFGKEIYSVAETLSSCWFIACRFFNVSTVPKIRHFKHNSSSFSTRNYKIDTFLHGGGGGGGRSNNRERVC